MKVDSDNGTCKHRLSNMDKQHLSNFSHANIELPHSELSNSPLFESHAWPITQSRERSLRSEEEAVGPQMVKTLRAAAQKLRSVTRHSPLGRLHAGLIRARGRSAHNADSSGLHCPQSAEGSTGIRPLLPMHLPPRPPEFNRRRRGDSKRQCVTIALNSGGQPGTWLSTRYLCLTFGPFSRRLIPTLPCSGWDLIR